MNNENEAKARASALAVNKNWNILLPFDTPYDGAKQADEEIGSQQSPEDFVSKVMDKANEEDVAVSEAEGKAIIKNKNINVVVYI